MLRLEARPVPSQVMTLASPVIALLLTALVAALILVGLGKDPVSGLRVIFIEPLSNRRQISEVLLKATPLIVIAVGLAVCDRANVWNIGAEGQFLLGCVGGGGMALWLTTQGIVLPKLVGIPLVLVAGMLGGLLWAALVALLRDRFNANEILVSLMLVYVAQQIINALVFG
ncbi:MAG: ABC transporter permease subunit, partial [Rubrivivax sp.]